MGGAVQKRTNFHLILIKPTHYDDDGYPITWLRSHIPSNTLAALYGLGEDCQQRQVLGPDVDILIKPFDETNIRVRPDRIVADIRRTGGKALICLVGVQSNQFPHAVDLARHFLKAGLPVAMGGFHAAGCLSMLPVVPPEIQAAMDMGISIFAGEAEEGRLDIVLKRRLERHAEAALQLHGRPAGHRGRADAAPAAGRAGAQRGPASRASTSAAAARSSARSAPSSTCRAARAASAIADDLEAIVRENYKQGITSFFITDDNMARNKHWEDFFDRLIELKENEGIEVSLIIQVDTQCHRIPNFIQKARWAGVYRVFIGLENVNPDNLLAAKKRQNKITEYRKMLQAWHASGASTWAGYILGFPGDTRKSIMRDLEIIKKELPLDILEFFMLTPLPGSEDHQTLWKQGVWMDPDLNKYDLNHRVVHHPKMSDAEYEQTYRDAWRTYYTPEHIETVARRHGAIPGRNPAEPAQFMTMFKIMFEAENIHPLEGGIVRLKYRRDRRYGMPIEPIGVFHYKLALETFKKLRIYGRLAWQGWRIGQKVLHDPKRHEYMDLALSPVVEEDLDKLALFAETAGGGAALSKRRGEDLARAKVAAKQNQQRLEAAE